MQLKKKYIRSLKSNIGFIKPSTRLMVGLKDIRRFQYNLEKAGFPREWKIGNSLLPASVFGPISVFNANGRYIKHKDRSMETAYRTVEWHWREWNGPYDRIDRSRFVDVPYKRYPRTFIEPPSIELTILKTTKDASVLVGPLVKYKDNDKELLHIINLFLEIFGECQLFSENLDEIIKSSVKRLNWKILPKGRRPWSDLQKELEVILKGVVKGNRSIVEYRLETINKYEPDFVAVGEAGFWGYIILGFQDKNLFVVESPFYGNATYIFDERWEDLSKKTKAEILSNDLQTDRIIHRENWKEKIRELFKK